MTARMINDRYQLLENDPVGRGAFGEVYKAQDTKLNRAVAVKFLRAERLNDAAAQRRFVEEARRSAGINHPNVVAVYDSGTHEGVPYIVMEWIEGFTLEAYVRHQIPPRLTVAQALPLFRQIAEGVQAAHLQGVLHRDIKPGNIFILPDGRIKVGDFGLAAVSERSSIGSSIVGSTGYLAPEAERGEYSQRSDVYALGQVLHFLLAGDRKHAGDGALHQSVPGLSSSITAVVDQALRTQPSDRYTTPSDLAAAFTSAATRRVITWPVLAAAALLIILAAWTATRWLWPAVEDSPVAPQAEVALADNLTPTPPADTATPASTNTDEPQPTPDLAATVQAGIAATQTAEPTATPTDIPTIEPIFTVTSTPDLVATVQAGIAATQTAAPTTASTEIPTTQPTFTETATPDLDATVQARIDATRTAEVTPTPIVIRVNIASSTSTPTPDLDATVQARVDATRTAETTPTPIVIRVNPALATATPNLDATVSARVAATQEALATPPPSMPMPADAVGIGVQRDPATGTWSYIKSFDGAKYMLIAAGPFTLGDIEGESDERPTRVVSVDDFWIMQTEVTNAQYGKCVDAGICSRPNNERWNDPAYAQHPVTHVSWIQAYLYASWVGGRLPTEAEWEKACQGSDERIYPWGNQQDTQNLNFANQFGDTEPVGSYPSGASPYGVLDMAGNVWEWTADRYTESYAATPPASSTTESSALEYRVIRGGSFDRSWRSDLYWPLVRCANRNDAVSSLRADNVGFRVVLDGD